jgi:cell division protein FtsB
MSKAPLVEQQNTTKAELLYAEIDQLKDQNSTLKVKVQALEDELALENVLHARKAV